MATTVLWFSRHEMTAEQRAGLERVAGGPVEVTQVNATINSVDEIQWEGQQIIAAVLPVQLLSDLMARVAGQATVVIPRNLRVRTETGEYQFRYGGWEIVLECVYRSEFVQ